MGYEVVYASGQRGPAKGNAAVAPSTPAPALVQLQTWTPNDNNGIDGNAYIFSTPNPTLAGNLLVLAIGYPFKAGRTISIVDSTGDTWPAATISTGTASLGNLRQSIFVLPNASAGQHKLTVTFDAAIRVFQPVVAEFYNVASADGSHGTIDSAAPNVATGAFTPTTNNDAAGGHLIFTHAVSDDTVGTNTANQASAMVATGGAKLLHADNTSTIPSITSYLVQGTNGSINPGFTITQSTPTNFLCSSVALKAGNVGTLPAAGIRVIRIIHCTQPNPATGNNTFLFPCDGNLLVATMAAGSDLNVVNSMSDTVNSSYADRTQTAGASRIFDKVNATPSAALALNVNLNAGESQFSIHLWDVTGAAVSPFDKATSVAGGAAPGSGTVCNDLPDHTPNTSAPALTISQSGFGTATQGAMAAGAPSGAIFDCISYTSAATFDQDRMDNADPFGHVYHSSNALQAWNYVIAANSHGSTVFATAATYKAA